MIQFTPAGNASGFRLLRGEGGRRNLLIACAAVLLLLTAAAAVIPQLADDTDATVDSSSASVPNVPNGAGVTKTVENTAGSATTGTSVMIIPSYYDTITASLVDGNSVYYVPLEIRLEAPYYDVVGYGDSASKVLSGTLIIPSTYVKNGQSFAPISIESGAFKSCHLTGVVIPDTVEYIKSDAFSYCNLTSVTFGLGIQIIENSAFDGNFYAADNQTLITQIKGLCGGTFTGELKHLHWTDLGSFTAAVPLGSGTVEMVFKITSQVGTTGTVQAGIGTSGPGHTCIPLTSAGALYIPKTVTYDGIVYTVAAVADGAFANCDGLTAVSIPSSVIRIDAGGFYQCLGLTSISFGTGLAMVNLSAFAGLSFYDSGVTTPLEPTAANLAGSIFNGDNQTLTKAGPSVITFQAPVEYGTGTVLMTFVLDSCEVQVGTGTEPCVTLTEFGALVIPATVSYNNHDYPVTSIAAEAFYSGGKIPVPLPGPGTGAVHQSYLTDVTIPDGVVSIGERAFFGCNALQRIYLPDSVTQLGIAAFYGCYDAQSLHLSAKLAVIPAACFGRCSGLRELIIPDAVKVISASTSHDPGSFVGCTGLTKIVFGSGLETVGERAFTPFVFYDTDGATPIASADQMLGATFVGSYSEDTGYKMVKQALPEPETPAPAKHVYQVTLGSVNGARITPQGGWTATAGTPLPFNVILQPGYALNGITATNAKVYSDGGQYYLADVTGPVALSVSTSYVGDPAGSGGDGDDGDELAVAVAIAAVAATICALIGLAFWRRL